jgi:hypothetical protein
MSVDVLAVLDALVQERRDRAKAYIANGVDSVQAVTEYAALNEVRAIVGSALEERDAFRAVLKEYQDARRISNPHTRQVAREIQQEAIARIGSAS